jgi:hypothetical protein
MSTDREVRLTPNELMERVKASRSVTVAASIAIGLGALMIAKVCGLLVCP